jgi:UDP-N-acetylmuramoyl-tripeptide--D-alanyl-D-alanine ligase
VRLSLAEIALGAGAKLEAPARSTGIGAFVAQGYSIDSRTVGAGELFFAVRGERHDGHDFIAGALARGALAAVVSLARVASLPDAVLEAPLLIVEDPLQALQALAAHVRRHWGGRVIAVTGSAGKTSTKDAVAAALGARFRVLKSLGNLNNGYGLPLQLLRLEREHEYAVIEMGMNHAGEIAQLARIAAPDWGVITNVGMAHVENFPDGQGGIARAKYELVEALPASGVAFLNCDDRYVGQFGRDFGGKVVYFGEGPCADPQITAISEADCLQVDLLSAGKAATLCLPLLGRHNASNAMAALAVAREAGVPLEAAIHALEGLTAGDKRGEVLSLSGEFAGVTIINDSYNSNPEALKSMIQALAAQPLTSSGQRRILVAGEMLELGDHARALHAACGRAAAEAGIDVVVGVRGNAEYLVVAATDAEVAGVAAIFLPDAEAAGAWLSENLKPGDVVLVKGSRGVRLERAIAIIQAE